MIWQVRTASMFIMMSVILMAIGSLVGALLGSMWAGLGIMLIMAVVFNLYAFFFSKKRALKANKVKLVTALEEPELYRIVQKITEKADMPMPEVGIVETYMPNAFATGRGPKDAAVVATRGLLNMLSEEEIEAVMAHEIAHVKNRDILVMSIASTMAAVLSYLSRYAMYAVMFGGGNSNNRALSLGIAVALSITVPIAAVLVQLGVSRSREYYADETGAKLTGKPLALVSALDNMEKGCESPKNEYNDNSYASMWISNPVRKKKNFFSSWFSTHPHTEDRITKLIELDNKMRSGDL